MKHIKDMLKRKKKRKTSLQRVKYPEKVITSALKPRKYKFPLDRLDVLEEDDVHSGEKKYTLKELKKKLTDRQRVFCHEYIKDWNGSRAARAAGYSEKSIRMVAHDTITKTYIRQYINYIQRDIAKEVGFSKLGLLAILNNHAQANLSELFEDWITRKEFNKLKEGHPQLTKSIKEVNTKVIRLQKKRGKKTYYEEVEYVKISVYDSQKAIEMIFKAMGWNEPKKVSVEQETTLNLGKGSIVAIRDAFGLK